MKQKIDDILSKHYPNIQDTFISGRDASKLGWTNDNTVNLSGSAYLDDNDVFHYSTSQNIKDNPVDLYNMINTHRTRLAPIYDMKRQYYKGRHINILNRKPTPHGDPDNRRIVNMPKKLVDSFNGYFIGTPVDIAYQDPSEEETSESDKVNNLIQDMTKHQVLDDVFTEASKWSSVYGRSYLYLYTDKDAYPHITFLDPLNTFIVYDNTVKNEPLFGVTYSYRPDKLGHQILHGSLIEVNDTVPFTSDATNMQSVSFDDNLDPDTGIDDKDAHPFSQLPIVEVIDNEERLGVFDDTVSLVDDLDGAVSAKANDSDSFAASVLKVINSELSDEQIDDIKQSRVLNLFLDKAWANSDESRALPTPDAEFMEKPTGDELQENQIQHDTDFIYQVSQIANLDNVDFSTSAAQALDFKIHSMKLKALAKETKFKRSLTQIWACALEAQGINVNDVDNLEYTFNFTIPHNLLAEAQTANELQSTTSQETAIASLSNVPDAKKEMQKIADEQDQLAQQAKERMPDPYLDPNSEDDTSNNDINNSSGGDE